jgi:hypothetical protein
LHGASRRRSLWVAALALLVATGAWLVGATAPAFGIASASKSHSPTPRAAVDTVTAFSNVTGRATALVLDTATVTRWKTAGVTVSPVGAATATSGGAGVELPITSGYVESHSQRSFQPRYLLGSIDHFGSGLSFATSAGALQVTNLVFDLGQSMVYATIGTTEDVPFFSLQQRDIRVVQASHTMRIEGAQLDLTPTGAAGLKALLPTSEIAPSTEIASAQITVAGQVSQYTASDQSAEYPRLSGIAVSVTFAHDALATFGRVGVTPGPAGSASYDSKSAKVGFPITGGTAVVHPAARRAPSRIAGVVLCWGTGLVLSGGSTSVAMTDLTYVPATSTMYASVNGGADNGAVFSVKRPKNSRLTTAGGNLYLRGALLDLTAGGAAMLDTVFHTTQFNAGDELGKLTLVASGA